MQVQTVSCLSDPLYCTPPPSLLLIWAVSVGQMLQKQLKGAMARPQRGSNPPSPRKTSNPNAPPARPQQPALGGLLELQQGLETPYQQSQVLAPVDTLVAFCCLMSPLSGKL